MVYFIIALCLLCVDLYCKHRVRVNYTKDFTLCKNKITITRIFNDVAMLGFMKDHAGKLLNITLVFLGILIGALLMLIGHKNKKLQKWGLTLMLAGAGSNIYDRLTRGRVTDYIQFNFGPEKFRQTVFNIGDCFIFIGGILSVIGFSKAETNI